MKYSKHLLQEVSRQDDTRHYSVWDFPAMPRLNLSEPYTLRRTYTRRKKTPAKSVVKPLTNALLSR